MQAQVSAIAALIILAGHAPAQTTPQPTYYPQCWFWQLPDNAAFVRDQNSLPHLNKKFVPALNVIIGPGTTPEEAVAQGKQRVLLLHSLGLYFPDRFALLPQNFKSEQYGPPLSALIHPNDALDLNIDNDPQNTNDWTRAGIDTEDVDEDGDNTDDLEHAASDKLRRQYLNPWLDSGTVYASNYHADFADRWRTASITFPQQPNNPVPNEMPIPARIMFDNEEPLTNAGGNMFTFLFNQIASDARYATHGIPGFPGGGSTAGNYVGHKTMQELWNQARNNYTGPFNTLTNNAFIAFNPWLPTTPRAVEEQESIPRYDTGWERWNPETLPLFNQDIGIWYMKLCQRARDAGKSSAIYSQWQDGFVRYDPVSDLPLGPFAQISNYGDFDCTPGTQDLGWHYDGKIITPSGALAPGALLRSNDRGQYDTFGNGVTRDRRSSGRWFLRDDYRASADLSAPVLYLAHNQPVAAGAIQLNPYVPTGHPDRIETRWTSSLREHRQTIESIVTSCFSEMTLVAADFQLAPWKSISPWIVPPGTSANEDGRDPVYAISMDESRRQLQLLRSKRIEDIQVFNPAAGSSWETARSDRYTDFIHVYRQVFEPRLRALGPRFGLWEPWPYPTGATLTTLAGIGATPPLEHVSDTNPRYIDRSPVLPELAPRYATVHEINDAGGNVFKSTSAPRVAGVFVETNLLDVDATMPANESYRIIVEAEVELLAGPGVSSATFTSALANMSVPCGYNLDVRGIVELRHYATGQMYKLKLAERSDDLYSFAVPLTAPAGAGQGTSPVSLVRMLGTAGDVGDPLRVSVSVRREFTLPVCIVALGSAGQSVRNFMNTATSGATFAVSFQLQPAINGTANYPVSMLRVRYDLLQVSRVDTSGGCETWGGGGGGPIGEEPLFAVQMAPADVDNSGDISQDDVEIFFNAFPSGGGEADQNVDGEVTSEDIVQFLQSYSGDE